MKKLRKVLGLEGDSLEKVRAQKNDTHYVELDSPKAYERLKEILTKPLDWVLEEFPDKFYEWVRR